VGITSSPRAIWPLGVANTTLWPPCVSTCQLTATSLGSKSTDGVGIKMRAKLGSWTCYVEPHCDMTSRSRVLESEPGIQQCDAIALPDASRRPAPSVHHPPPRAVTGAERDRLSTAPPSRS
jgi:hypothetical protein